jgi:hypothetical protein
MNSTTTTRRTAAFVCAAVATLTMLAGTDVLATHMNGNAVIAAGSSTAPATQVVVITGQRVSGS